MEQNEQWVSASDLARSLGVSTQTIYNRVKKGVYETKVFNRGAYKGILIKN
jgi:prophage antirepressor-like protein